MKRRPFLAHLFCAVAFATCAATITLSAAPLSHGASALAPTETSTLVRVQYGCGWDYACPPRPSYGRRSSGTPQVYIENNYGTVNLYQNGRHGRPTGARTNAAIAATATRSGAAPGIVRATLAVKAAGFGAGIAASGTAIAAMAARPIGSRRATNASVKRPSVTGPPLIVIGRAPAPIAIRGGNTMTTRLPASSVRA